ncbi:MAG TPA: serine/threonine-protein kinase [Gemmataceae bacterium]|nr:serine/threonine-protein kinase [Gemmataceae bacterium]
MFLPEPEPTDDSPTVISRAPPRPAPSDESFAGTLRGRRLAHFELIEPIGVGGMAAVIRARDTQLDRPVALKILPPEMANDPESVKRFHQEARAAARLDHENIARVFFCGEDQGLHFIAFEFVEGVNLRTLLERRGRLPVAEAVHYLLQIATGLEHAASRGVVHRDIKPSNIIISPNGRAKLVDMGLARSLDRQSDAGLTQSGVTLGTFDYISPEQALEPREADVRSDIYSLGCTFYHVLTGQPPVPEGTAAKKLHHHQHVAPIDPRELNPEIPDELAAILARMMAKDPKDRYAHVGQLVRHLIGVAQKLGLNAEVPEGLLFVDAPLPDPPRARPILLAAVAATALVGLILLLGRTGGPATSPSDPVFRVPPDRPPPAPRADRPDQSPRTRLPAPAETPNGTAPQRGPKVAVFNPPHPQARDLARFLRENQGADEIQVVLNGDLELGGAWQGDESASVSSLVFEAPKVTIEGRSGARPTIRLKYDLRLPSPADGLLAALVIRGGEGTLKNLRLVVDAASSQASMAGVLFQGGKGHKIHGCEFLQENPPPEPVLDGPDERPGPPRLTSVVVDAGRDPAVAVEIKECYFARVQDEKGLYRVAQDAVRLIGPGRVLAAHCAFAPHTILFHLARGGSISQEAMLALENCSAMAAGDWTAFHLEDSTPCRLEVKNCLFSRVGADPDAEPGSSADRRAVLIHQAGRPPTALKYVGFQNCYHNLTAFWVRPTLDESEAEIASWEAFAEEVRKVGGEEGQDVKSVVLKQSPWQEADPLDMLRQGRPQQAFLVNLKLRELRYGPDLKQLLGVERCAWGTSYPNVPPLPPEDRPTEPVAAVRELVVDPAVASVGNGVYRTLGQALEDVRQRAVIRIRHTGLLPVDPVRLERATLDVTILPDPGHRPILTLGNTSEQEAFLFRVHDGKLTLEDLEFQLEPRRAGYKTQSVVEVIGEGSCAFRDCVITLDRAGRDVPLAVVKLADPALVMKMDPPSPAAAQVPGISFEDCLVRGDGELLRVRASRPFTLEARNCLFALAGSCLNVQGSAEGAAAGQVSVARLEHVTAYLGEHLIRLQAHREARGMGLVLLHVRAFDSLFVSRDAGSLIHLEGPETSEEKMRGLLLWDGRHNAYSNFMSLLDQRSPGEENPPQPYGTVKWKEYTGERDALFVPRVRSILADPPPPEAPLARVGKAGFRVRADADQSYGANLDRLPTPTGAAAAGSEE